VYSKAGTLPAAALIREETSLIDHTLYWAEVETIAEGHYLLAILNSETARKRAESLQARGQWGARHFDKVMLSLPIPPFERSRRLHMSLANAAARAERVASVVDINDDVHFVTARRRIRAVLHEDGITQKIDSLVEELI